MRGRSYTPSPPRGGYGRRGRSPSPRGRYGGRARDGPTSLLVRNLRRDCRPEDLRRPFGQFGPLKDIYLPRDYYTGDPRGFGFVQYMEPDDAAEAKYQMDGQILQGRQLTVVFAEENRKKPNEMRAREHRYARSRSREYYSPKRKGYSRSASPEERRYSRERSFSRSPVRERSPPYNGSRSRSQTPVREQSPPYSRSRSRSPVRRGHSPQSRSRSPNNGGRGRHFDQQDYPRAGPERDGSPRN
ncbi:serine/arginine-rich SC35-like splicing factor SCL30A isoform X2 [Ipomoea triloba]|uniref:serine/arginine-rich SC35-like splicing factor SCL30A isoform X2 n=1 Tax=Ipomoea triloba TaxID=35885 RepID=UPI00125E5279|nr:serine/arginine-rich SC35-like splicing factor SCL30A isoform X2 [Ipomoea triloba]